MNRLNSLAWGSGGVIGVGGDGLLNDTLVISNGAVEDADPD